MHISEPKKAKTVIPDLAKLLRENTSLFLINSLYIKNVNHNSLTIGNHTFKQKQNKSARIIKEFRDCETSQITRARPLSYIFHKTQIIRYLSAVGNLLIIRQNEYVVS